MTCRMNFVSIVPLFVMAASAMAQSLTVDIKTPPGAAGSPFQLNIPTLMPTQGNWVGFRGKLHILDPTEVQRASINVTAFDKTNKTPLGLVGSATVAGNGLVFFTVVTSPGIADPVSIQVTGTVFPIGTSVGQNSDVDVTAMLWNIRHIATPTALSIGVSDLYISDLGGQLPAASGPGNWFHNTGPLAVITPAPPTSALHGTLALMLNVGVEHNVIPEPLSMSIWGCGLICGVLGLRARRRRVRAAH